MKIILLLLLTLTSASAQSLGGCTTGNTAWSGVDEADCLKRGGTYYPFSTVMGTMPPGLITPGSTVTTHTLKCPDGYSLVNAGRPICAKDFVEPR